MKITIDFDNKTINPISEVYIQELSQKMAEMFPNDYWEWKMEHAPIASWNPMPPFYAQQFEPVAPYFQNTVSK